MVNINFDCADYMRKAVVPDDQSENNYMKDRDECIETIFQQQSQEEIIFFYQEIWEK